MSSYPVLFSVSLRTSETSYLNEAFSFYSAIRQRSYYYQVNKEDRWESLVFIINNNNNEMSVLPNDLTSFLSMRLI